MIRNLTSKNPTIAATSLNFFSRLAKALPREFRELPNWGFVGGKPCGYYQDKFELDCFRELVIEPGAESYLFKMCEPPDEHTPKALADFLEDIRKVAKRAGYDEVGRNKKLFKESFSISVEDPIEIRLLVKN